MAWIEVHTNLPRHDKTLQLQSLLHLNIAQTLGHLLLLWIWALESSEDGRLGRLDAKGIAGICHFNVRRANEFLQALLQSGFLDRTEEGLRVHDWEEYGGRYQQIRRTNAERKRRQRSRVTNVTVTGHKDSTGQNRTEQDLTGQDRLSSSGGGDDAGADAQVREFLLERGLLPEEYLGADQALLDACRTLTEQLFQRLAGRQPTQLDQARVFCAVTVCGDGGARVDGDRRDLLCYAFEQAAAAGRGGQWPYIEGVLGRLHRRGIRDLRAAEDFELERAGL